MIMHVEGDGVGSKEEHMILSDVNFYVSHPF